MEDIDESVSDISPSESEYNPSSSASSGDETSLPNVYRKRMRNKNEWARKKRKACRAKGKEYINVAGKVVPPRITGPDCKCKRQCYNKVSADIKSALLQSFNELKDKDQQDAYLCGLITVTKVQRRRPRTGEGSWREYTSFYKVREGAFETVVCKRSFCGLHGVTKSRVDRLCKHLTQHATPPSDKRETHKSRPNKIQQHVTAQVDAHIRSFPRRRSHYSRCDNAKRYYLSCELNVKKMYLLYLQKYEPDEYLQIQSGRNTNVQVSYDYYYRYFTTNFNMFFGKPRSDTCQECDIMEKRLNACTTEEEKQEIKMQKELHLRRAETFYDQLKELSKCAKQEKNVETICFDFQKNMPMPSTPSGDVFYSRQLWEYSFCIHVSSTGKSYFYMYDETCGKKGPSEVISLLHHFISNILDKNVQILNVFTDNCNAQNKNHSMVHYLYTQVYNGSFKNITHMFPVPGHSFLPCDRSFGLVEKEKKKHEWLYLPSDWKRLVKGTSKKFHVIDFTQDLLLNFACHSKKLFKSNVKSADNVKFSISKYRFFEYSTEHKHVVRCSLSLSNLVHHDFIIQKPSTTLTFPEEKLYNGPLPVKSEKYRDVMKLAEKYVPPSEL